MNNFTVKEKRLFRNLFYRSLTVWSMGNALTPGIVAALMAISISEMSWGAATALAFSASFAGNLFRLFSASILEKFKSSRKVAVSLYFLQGATLITAALIFGSGGGLGRWQAGLFLLCWFASCIFENLAFVMLLSWMGSIFPRKILGRFSGRRERWRLCGEIPVVFLTLVVLTAIAQIYFNGRYPNEIARIIYQTSFLTGGALISISALFLLRISENKANSPLKQTYGQKWRLNWRSLREPIKNPVFRWLLAYAFFCSLFVQMEQTTRSAFQKEILGGDGVRFALLTGGFQLVTRFTQVCLALMAGRLVDRLGSLTVMKFSQPLTALAVLFYVAAVFYPTPWLLLGAAFVWSSYVGINAALPKIQLEFSERNEVSWSTAYGMFSGVGGFLGLIAGAFIFDYCQAFPKFIGAFFSLAFCLRLVMTVPLIFADSTFKKQKSRGISQNNPS